MKTKTRSPILVIFALDEFQVSFREVAKLEVRAGKVRMNRPLDALALANKQKWTL
jgi:hypothetical protein